MKFLVAFERDNVRCINFVWKENEMAVRKWFATAHPRSILVEIKELHY